MRMISRDGDGYIDLQNNNIQYTHPFLFFIFVIFGEATVTLCDRFLKKFMSCERQDSAPVIY